MKEEFVHLSSVRFANGLRICLFEESELFISPFAGNRFNGNAMPLYHAPQKEKSSSKLMDHISVEVALRERTVRSDTSEDL